MIRLLTIAVLVLAVVALALWLSDTGLLSLQAVQAELGTLRAQAAARPVATPLAFAAAYALVAALSIPGGSLVLSFAAGAIFGLVTGSVVVSFGSSIGAALACLGARFLLRDVVERRFSNMAAAINRGLDRDGSAYLFALRLVPVFPFFAINLALGLTRLPLRTFYWVSQLGMLPATVLYVNAGRELGRVTAGSDVLSPGVLGALALLGVFPLLARRGLRALQARRRLARWPRPRRFDVNVVVIGAGSAGLVAAYVAAAARARVVLVEQAEMGGDCLNRGCVPSKALLRAARLRADLRRAREFGLAAEAGPVDLAAVLGRVRAAVARVAPHDSVERYTGLGVECVAGTARIVSPWAVAVGDRVITTRGIIVATGGGPVLPPVPGLADVPHVTSDTVWQLPALPERLLVLGGGPVGCELAQAFARLGSAVTLVEAGPRLLAREDPAAAALVASRFADEGIRVLPGCRPLRFEPAATGGTLACRHADGREETLAFDQVLVATGRRARTEGLGLEELGVGLNPDGTVATDDCLQTALPTIHACGDAAGPFQLTHAASHQAWYAAMNALYGRWWRFRADYRVLPACVFTDPEVARVGLTEAEARAQGLDIEVTTWDLAELDRAIADGDNTGLVKVVTPRGRDRILGATVVGPHAGEVLAELSLAMRHGLGLRKVLGTVHSYPTLAEANRLTAGAWQRNHLPLRLLGIAERVNRWQRGGPA
ncbi:MAG: FAD-dependent oxidoreductase [Chromatiales bacterium]|jgi:pyruvate/2-oxoglutarate dehydrogenase complex dihydrolipoamide dehydrogenase (E3) component/uncharacterized membrane protein YdjX (TVP38/TMEM64 family)|nr:FAD-dependent oxidoreductase [Chromatiales bacterium]